MLRNDKLRASAFANCAVAALACAIASAAATAQSIPSTAIALRYEDSLITRGFPSPMLRATINGASAWFIVDTGASVHTLASWFASAAHLSSRKTTATVTGSTGKEKPVRVITNRTLQLQGGSQLELREAIVVDFPASFAKNRIGGLLSPQLLASGHAATVLDLKVPMLRFEPFDEAVQGLGGQRVLTSSASQVCANAHSPLQNRLYAAPVRVDTIAGTMLLDTGATSTLATPGSPIAEGLKSRATENTSTRGVGGKKQTMRKTPGVRLEYGGSALTIAVTIGGAQPSCGPDGRIGMDALRQCILVLGESAFAWSCQAS